MPVAVKGGYAFGAYDLRASHGTHRRRRGAAAPQVGQDRHRGDHRLDGRRRGSARLDVRQSAACPASRTLGVREASRKAGTRHGIEGLRHGHRRSTRSGSRLASGRVDAIAGGTWPAQPVRHRRRISKRDQDYARQAWTLARARNQVCDASARLDPNDDGCADIVDLQATLAANGRAAGRSAITPMRTDATSSRPDGTRTDRSRRRSPGCHPAARPRTSRRAPDDLPRIRRWTRRRAPRWMPRRSRELPAVPVSARGGAGKGAAGKVGAPGRWRRRRSTTRRRGQDLHRQQHRRHGRRGAGDGVCADTQGRCTLRAAIAEADFRAG